MKQGQLIRRKGPFNNPVGPWMIIRDANAHHIYAESMLSHEMLLIMRENVWEPKVVRLAVSPSILEKVEKGIQICLTHALPSKTWEELLNVDPQKTIILLYNQYGEKLYVTFCDVSVRFIAGERNIKVLLNQVIL